MVRSSGWHDNTPAAGETQPYGYKQGPGYTHPDSVTVCVDVDWPAPYQWKSKLEHGRGVVGPASWMGSLIEGGRDLTGQMYMRSRFYDPASGRFTQEDPIGIAGGLNVYGFANGDPVTNSDPYGLKADGCGSKKDEKPCRNPKADGSKPWYEDHNHNTVQENSVAIDQA